MALTSVYYDGPVTESQRAQNRAGAPEYGVYGIQDCQVVAHPSIPYAVMVKAGRAHGHGVTDEAAIDQVVQCQSLTSGTRWDLIVIRRNWQPELGGPSTLEVIQGGAAPEIPSSRKVVPGVEDDQPLALVEWKGGLSAPNRIIDLRVWASNGGMYAKDELVLTYLTGIGTEINVNSVLWRSTMGPNNLVSWTKTGEIGKIPLFGAGGQVFGGVPPNGGDFLIQAGSLVQTTDNSGYARITFPKPFPSGMLAVLITNGDSYSTSGRVAFQVAGNPGIFGPSGQGDRTSVVYVSHDTINGAAQLRPNMLHRINWIAIGW